MTRRTPRRIRGIRVRNGKIGGKTKGQVALTNLTLLATISNRPKGA